MHFRFDSLAIAVAACATVSFLSSGSAAERSDSVSEAVRPEAELTYEQDIRPILKTHCFHCHGEDGQMQGQLDVRLRRLLVAGGKRDYPNLNVPRRGALALYLELFEEGRKLKEELAQLWAKVGEIRAQKPPQDFLRALTEPANKPPPPTYIFHRGDHGQPTEEVQPGGLSVLEHVISPAIPVNNPQLPTTGRRLAYAQYLTDPRHPLVARVLANWVWRHHFGRGLVDTPGDFGTQGSPPTHPELLDWLARELIESGWDLKHLHRLIVTSTAYRQVARRTPALDELDPDNRLLGRMPVRRTEAETLREAMLQVSGQLSSRVGGPPVPVALNDDGQVVVPSDNEPAAARRSIYIQRKRSQPLALLETFDAPQMSPNCTARQSSTVSSQALLLMNSQFMLRQARQLAERVELETGEDLSAQSRRVWQLVLVRQPREDELQAATDYLARQAQLYTSEASPLEGLDPSQQALVNLCQVLLSSNEFLYVD